MHKVHEPRKGGMAAAGKDDKVPAMMESAKPVGVAK